MIIYARALFVDGLDCVLLSLVWPFKNVLFTQGGGKQRYTAVLQDS